MNFNLWASGFTAGFILPHIKEHHPNAAFIMAVLSLLNLAFAYFARRAAQESAAKPIDDYSSKWDAADDCKRSAAKEGEND